MSNRSKGKRREKEVKQFYERAGYAVFKPQESKFDETDMFGLFDLFAMPTPECRDTHPRLVQVKSNRPGGYSTWFEDVMETFGPSSVIPELVAVYDHEGCRLIGIADDGETATDFVNERHSDCEMGVELVEYLQEYVNETDVNRPFGVTD